MKAALFELLAISILTQGCEGDAGALDAGPPPPPIVGDWFTCDDGCRKLRSGGLRFTSDLHVHHLVSPEGDPSYVEGDPYCVGESFATYVHDEGLLWLTFHDGSLEAASDFEVDDGGVTALHGTMRKVTPNGTGRWDDERCLSP